MPTPLPACEKCKRADWPDTFDLGPVLVALCPCGARLYYQTPAGQAAERARECTPPRFRRPALGLARVRF